MKNFDVFKQLILHFSPLSRRRFLRLKEELVLQLKALEKTPVSLSNAKKNEGQKKKLARIQKEAKELMLWNEGRLYKELIPYCQAAAYRLGIDALLFSPSHYAWLKETAEKWCCRHEILHGRRLDQDALLKLREAAEYPKFIDLLKESSLLLDRFFTWCIRDKCNVKVFILFPFLYEKLIKAGMQGRLGRYPHILQVGAFPSLRYGQNQELHVTLLFEGVPHSILDEENTICLRGNWCLSIEEVFAHFGKKQVGVGNLEVFAGGVTNWNAHSWGYWDNEKRKLCCLNFSHPLWWWQLPVQEVLTAKEASTRFGIVLDGKKWLVAASATRGARTLNYRNTHAFLKLAIPLGNGNYQLFDFGKYATRYPRSEFEAVFMLCQNLYATISYPDENIFYSHREEASYPFLLTQEEGLCLLEKIRSDMWKGVKKNIVYQIESDNCAKWVQESLEYTLGKKRVPHLFYISLLHTEPEGLVAHIFSAIRKLPKQLQIPVLSTAHLLFGAHRKILVVEEGEVVWKSLTRHRFWKTGCVFLPSLLVKKVRLGELTFSMNPIESVIFFFLKKEQIFPSYLPFFPLLNPLVEGRPP